MKILTEVTVPSFSTFVVISVIPETNLIEGDEIRVMVPETEQVVEINLNDLGWDDLVKYVEGTEDTLVNNEELQNYINIEQQFAELIDYFEKHTLNKIKRQEIIQNIIDQLDAT